MNTTTESTLFDAVWPDVIGQMLGSPFKNFRSGPTCGLYDEHEGTLILLAIASEDAGKGHFRAFIAKAKEQYDSIVVLEIWNPWLPEVLARYGFKPYEETDPKTKEHLTGMKWTR